MNSSINNRLNGSFESNDSPIFTKSCLQTRLTEFSSATANLLQRFSKSAMFVLLSLFLLSFTVVRNIQAQEQVALPISQPALVKSDGGLFTPSKVENILSSNIDNLFAACTYTYSPGNLWWQYFPGLVTTVTVTTQAGCPWSVISNDSWLIIDSGSGARTGTGTFSYHPLQNNGPFRSGTLTITGAGQTQFNYQDSPTPVCSDTPISYGQIITTGATSTSDCTIYGIYTDVYTFNGNAGDQIAISMNSSQFTPYPRLTGANSLNEIQANSLRIPSSGFFTLPASGVYKIRAGSGFFNTFLPNPSQGLGAYTLQLTTASTTTYSLTGQVTDENGAGLGGVTMTLNPNSPGLSEDTGDTAPSTVDATTVTDSSGNYTFSGLSNFSNWVVFPTQSGRTFNPGPQQVTINGSNPPPANFQRVSLCTYSLNPASNIVQPIGGSFTFNVTTNPGCPWTALSNSPWITTSSSGTGSGTVGYTVNSNTVTLPRDGLISVNGVNYFISQNAAPCTPTFTPSSASVNGESGTYSFNVFVPSGCPWTATASAPWIRTTSTGTGNGSVVYSVDPNPGATRSGTITVLTRTFAVSQNSQSNTTYSISGTIRSGGNPLSGVTVAVNGPVARTTVTAANGQYQLSVPPGAYTIIPSLGGAVFSPASAPVNIVSSNPPAQDFGLAVCSYTLSAPGSSVPVIESLGSFDVNASAGCGTTAWKAISNVPWIIVRNEGVGSGTQGVTYFVQRNYGSARSGIIAVNGQIYTVTQASFANQSNSPEVDQCRVNVANPNSNNQRVQILPYTAGNPSSLVVNIINQGNQPNCQWTAEPSANWIEVNNRTGTNNNTVQFSVQENNTGAPKFGTIAVNGEVYRIVQTPLQRVNCNYTLNPTGNTYTSLAASDSFTIVSNCPWVPSVDESMAISNWLTADTEGGAPGPATRSFSIKANTGMVPLSTAIVIGNKSFVINQTAAAAPVCDYSLPSNSQTVAAPLGSTGNFGVSASMGCPWQATTTAPWITISGFSGTGDGTVNFATTQVNPTSSPRTGTITVEGKSFTVTQPGTQQSCSTVLSQSYQNVPRTGAAGTIQITSNCPWSVTENDGWIAITSGASGTGNGAVQFVVQTNPTNTERTGKIKFIDGQIFTITQAPGTSRNTKTRFDFDGDGKSDVSVFRPNGGFWYLLNSTSGFTGSQFGASTDKIVPADYDGDGKTDVAVYRGGTWYIQRSQLGFTGIQFGDGSDSPQPADFDGDGKAELAVFRPSNGGWYIYNLVNGQFTSAQFGALGDKPVVGDYDGDRKADYAVYRNDTWYLQRSTLGFTGIQFGANGDKPVPADYDGDGKTDIAVFRNGNWYLQQSSTGFTGIQFGNPTDLPVPADYDGDGKADISVFRNDTWYLQRSNAGFTGIQFGGAGDKPVPNAFVP